MTDWVPLSARDDRTAAAEWEVLVEGVPEWLRPRLMQWVTDALVVNRQTQMMGSRRPVSVPDPAASATRLMDAAVALRETIPNDAPNQIDYLFDAKGLDLVDWLCAHRYGDEAELEAILVAAGSAWRVGTDAEGRGCLERRVPETAHAQFEQAASVGDQAARKLREAWHDVYGRNPDPPDAYVAAVKAVEAVLCPLVLPNNAEATLGQVIAHLRDAPGRWRVGIGRDGMTDVERFTGLLQLLWRGHQDRHLSRPDVADTDEATATHAVHLAVTIVQLVRDTFLVRAT